MTLPLVTLPGAGAGPPAAPGAVLILTCPPGLALGTRPGHGTRPGRTRIGVCWPSFMMLSASSSTVAGLGSARRLTGT